MFRFLKFGEIGFHSKAGAYFDSAPTFHSVVATKRACVDQILPTKKWNLPPNIYGYRHMGLQRRSSQRAECTYVVLRTHARLPSWNYLRGSNCSRLRHIHHLLSVRMTLLRCRYTRGGYSLIPSFHCVHIFEHAATNIPLKYRTHVRR